MKNIFTFLFLTFFSAILYGQKQANIWHFGADGAGLDFNHGCNPVVLNDGAFYGFEGVATIADKNTGELLFYTNSEQVWNKNHDTIPNSKLVTNGSTITQVLILQKPASANIYYIITSEVQGFSGQHYRYHAIDMSMNNGLGGMLFKDSILHNQATTEKLTAIRHGNGTDIWIVGHQCNSTNYLAFKVTPSGIDTNAIVSSIGKYHGDQSTVDAIGELKASPNGMKIAAVTLYHCDIELFDFDNVSGQISNLITIPAHAGYDALMHPISNLYGLSFSMNSSVLYASQWKSSDSAAKIFQMDISSNDSATISNSKTTLFASQTSNAYSLKLAPDMRIYIARNESKNYLSVINFPDIVGLGCGFVDTGISLGASHSGWGLNNLMEYGYYCDLEPNSTSNIAVDNKINMSPNPFSEYALLEFNYLPSKKYRLKIFSILGIEMQYPIEIKNNKTRIERRNLSNGVYFYQLNCDGSTLQTGKFCID